MINIAKYLYLLNGTQHLRNNLDKYIEAFVEYYGEEEREHIVEKFSDATFFLTISPEKLLQITTEANKEISDYLVKELIDKSNLDFTPNDLTGGAALKNISFTPLCEFRKFYELLLLGKENRKELFINNGFEFLNGFYSDLTKEQYISLITSKTPLSELDRIPEFFKSTLEYYTDLVNADDDFKKTYEKCAGIIHKINPNITVDNCEKYLDELSNLYSLSSTMLEKYNTLVEPLVPFEKEYEEHKAKSSVLTEKYFRKLVENNLDCIPDNELDKVKDYLEGKIDRFELSEYIRFIFKSSILSDISCFNSESESLLDNPDVQEWRKDSIKNDRIRLYNILGINLGEVYEDYLKDGRVQEITSRHIKLADKIEEEYAKYKNEQNVELFSYYDRYKTMREEVDGLGLLDKNDGLNQSIFTLSTNTFVAPNVIMRNDETKLHPLITIGADSYTSGFLDHSICHELNHLYELVLLDINENGFSYNCGWDRGSSKYDTEVLINTIDEPKEKRPYELFNEIINELISQDISKIMADKKVFVFDDPENSKYKGYTSYEETRFLVTAFFEEFKNEIIKSRRDGDYQILFDKVGQNNFEELNNLVVDFVRKVNGFKFFSMINALKNGIDNELTRFYHSTVEKRDIIINNMRNYKRTIISTEPAPSVHM